MRARMVWAMAMLWLTTLAGLCAASVQYVEEVWRSPGGRLGGLSSQQVDERDGSLWLTEGATVTRWSRDGELLARSPALCGPDLLAPNSADGSCWVSQGLSDGMVHLGADANVLSVTPGFGDVELLTASPYDGSVWVSHMVSGGAPDWIHFHYLSHVSASGQELSRWELSRNYYGRPGYVIVDPGDGSVWASTETGVIRARADGSRLWDAPYPGPADADPYDQSLWVAAGGGTAVHLSADGELLWQSGDLGPSSAYRISELHVSHADRSVWISFDKWFEYFSRARSGEYLPSDQKVHLDSSGAVLPAPDGFLRFYNDLDGSVWTWVSGSSEMTHYSSDGQAIGVFAGGHLASAYDQTRNTFWSVDADGLGYLGPDGAVLWQQERLPELRLMGRTVNAQDGSVWAMDGEEMIRFSPEGEELERRPLVPALTFDSGSLSISPVDGSWWVDSAGTGSLLLHYAPDGAELSSHPEFGWEPQISQYDGSVWGAWVYQTLDGLPHSFLNHIAPGGTLLSKREYSCPISIPMVWGDGSAWVGVAYPEGWALERLSNTGELLASIPCPWLPATASVFAVSPADGSFYVVSGDTDPNDDLYDGWIGRVAADGTTLWRQDGLPNLESTVVDPQDGSAWITSWGTWGDEFSADSLVAHFAADGTELWRSGAFNGPWRLSLDRRDGSVWVSDLKNDQIVHLRVVTRPFPDVPEGFWARAAIADCLAAGIVEGFPGGNYRPDLAVTRGQMAVYIARALALPTGDSAVQVPSGAAEPTFPDVDEEHWAYRYVEYCYAAGAVEGYPGGNYQPDEPVNRGQMAVYIARALVTPSGDAGLPDPPDEPTFPDVTAENDWTWCYSQVEYCAAEGVVQGYWDGYHPERVVTRDQMAVYVARAFDLPL